MPRPNLRLSPFSISMSRRSLFPTRRSLPNRADIIQGPKLAIRNGRMEISEGPGFGVTIDPDKLARAHEVYRKSGMRGRDDASLMKNLEPGWDGGLL